MLNISIPNNNLSERTYILDILLGEFLGLKFDVKISNEEKNWRIQTEAGKVIVIRDNFFSNFPKPLSYLSKDNIPNEVLFIENPYAIEDNIPILFGDNEFTESSSEVLIGNDILAASFFMLTRWEEHVNKERDKHERFPASESLAYKFSFLERPIVNEYVEFLWVLLQKLGIQLKAKPPKRLTSCIFHYLVDKKYLTDLFYFQCFDPSLKTFRVTLYDNYSEGISNKYRITVEVLSENVPNKIDELQTEIFDELIKMNVLPTDVKVLNKSYNMYPNGFPVLTNEFIKASKDQVNAIKTNFTNVEVFGKSNGKAWFMYDIINDIYKSVTK